MKSCPLSAPTYYQCSLLPEMILFCVFRVGLVEKLAIDYHRALKIIEGIAYSEETESRGLWNRRTESRCKRLSSTVRDMPTATTKMNA
jgi:hypothetical protein